MARGGITKKSVEQARNALIARGESVSIDAVRIELGNTGSKTTIHRYLKELETDDDKTALSASLSDELIALVNQLSSRLKAEANQTLEAQEERHSEQVNAWQERFEQQSQELLATQTHVEELMQTLQQAEQHQQQLREINHQLEVENERLQSDLSSQKQRLSEKDDRIASLEEKHTQVKAYVARTSIKHRV